MSILGDCPVVRQAARGRAQVTALLPKGLLAPTLICLDAMSALGVFVLSVGGGFRIVVGQTANEEVDGFILSPVRLVAMLLGDSQGAGVEVAASRLPVSEKTGLVVESASQSVRDCAVCARVSIPPVEHVEGARAGPRTE